MNAMTLNILGF